MRTTIIALSIGTMLGFSLAGCASVHEQGMRALQKEDLQSAEGHARRALDEKPDDPRSHLLMARVLVAKDDLYGAIPHARKAFESEELLLEAGRLLGKIHWDIAQPVDAAEIWTLTRAKQPGAVSDQDFARAIEAALAATTLAQDHERALAFRKIFAALSPDHPQASPESFRLNRERLATEYTHVGRLEDAIALYDELRKEFSERPFYGLEMGQLLVRLNRGDEARQAWQQYVDAFEPARRTQRLLEVAGRAEQLLDTPLALIFYEQALTSMNEEKASFRRATLRLRIAALLFTNNQSQKGREQVLAYLEDMRQLRGLPLSPEVYVTGAETALNHQHPELAFELLEQGLRDAPPSWRIAQPLAELYAHRAQTQDVERVLATYVERAESKVDAELHAARWAAGRRNHELARHYYRSALTHPSTALADIWLELARLFASTNEPEELRDALQNFLRLRENNRQAMLDAAALLQSQRLFEDAERILLRALRQDQASLAIVDRLANLYLEWERTGDVRELFDRWIRARGNSTEDVQLVADRFMRQNHFDEARYYYERAAREGQPEAWIQVADIYRRQRRDPEMKAALDRYLDAAPNRLRALSEVLTRYRSSAMHREAVLVLNELVELEPRQWSHWEQLAEIYLENSQDSEAINLLRRYMQASGRQLEALESIGKRLEQRGHGRWLVAFYEELLDGGEKDPRLIRMLGDAYYTASQYGRGFDTSSREALNQANHYYKRYIDEAPLSPVELADFAGQLRHRRIWPAARQAYEKLLDKRPPTGQNLVNYGAVLLELGEIERAEEIFNTHYEMRGRDPQEGRNIAQHLFAFHRYEAAEPYLLDLFEADSQDFLHQSFSILAEIYRNSDRPERLAGLIQRFLERAQNKTRARQTVLTILENSGLWNETVEQIERMREGGSTAMDWTLAQSYFRLGKEDKAREVFQRFADTSPDQASSWVLIGQFYESRALVDLAADAYDRALRQQPDNPLARTYRGRLHLYRGEIEAGMADFNHIFRIESGPQSNEYRVVLAETLQEIGRFAEARQVARQSLVHAPYERDFLLRLIAQEELDTDDPARIDQAIVRLREQGMTLSALVQLLDAFGHGEWGLRAIEEELDTGDQDQALNVLIEQIELFTRLGGIERLREAISPLLDQSPAENGRLLAVLGNFLVREGQLEEGVLHLQASIDLGFHQLLPMLAHSLAMLGRHQEAHARFQHHLARVQGPLLPYELRVIALRYEFLGQSQELLELLRHLARDTRFAHEAAPMWLIYTLEATNDVFSTLDTLRATSAFQRLIEKSSEGPPLRTEIQIVINSLEAIASRGFSEEVRATLAELPEAVQTSEAARDLEVRLASLHIKGSDDVFDRALSRLEPTQQGHLERLRIARTLFVNGHDEQARDLVKGLITSPDRVVAAQALDLVLSTSMAADKGTQLDGDLNTYLDAAPDKQLARSTAADHLSRLGLDQEQFALRNKSATMMATESNVTAAFNAAVMSGDQAQVRRLTDSVLRIVEDPVTFLQAYTSSTARLEPEIVEITLGALRNAYPAHIEMRLNTTRTLFREGAVDEARALLLEYLQSVDFERTSVEWILSELSSERLYVEAARFVAPLVPEENLSPNAMRVIGLANLAIGLDEEAKSYFERFLEGSSDRALAAAELARRLQEDHHYRASVDYAELAVELRPDRPEGYLYRGITRLTAGRINEAQVDIDHALSQGIGQMLGLYRVASAALYAGEEEFATAHLKRLTMTPIAEGFQVLYPLRLALSAFDDTDRAASGVRFLEAHYPRLAAGKGIARAEVATFSSGIFERSGNAADVYALYDGAIYNERVRAPLGPALPTYLNNLAYTYSTTNRNIDQGIDMVRRAIAAADARSSAYIDTLGWLYYRAGDYPRAEAEIRRAIRSSGGSPPELKELYEHLADLLELQGRFDEAIWVRIFVSRIR